MFLVAVHYIQDANDLHRLLSGPKPYTPFECQTCFLKPLATVSVSLEASGVDECRASRMEGDMMESIEARAEDEPTYDEPHDARVARGRVAVLECFYGASCAIHMCGSGERG